MVGGQAGLGKTTFLATLFDQINPPVLDESSESWTFARTQEIIKYSIGMLSLNLGVICCVELEPESGVRLLIDAIDTPGYGDKIDPKDQ